MIKTTQIKLFVVGVLACTLLVATSCARLYHVQVTDIEPLDSTHFDVRPFEVKVSEMGFSIQEAAGIAKAFTQNQRARDQIGQAEAILALFQFGPKTGKPVFSDTYADELFMKIRSECPNGTISGLVSIREQRSYPVVSGEIVKILGYCSEPKNQDVTKKGNNHV